MKSLPFVLAFGALALAAYAFQGIRPTKSDKAPEFVGNTWLNVAGKPPTLASRAGKPTLVAFWTFACSNCQANLPPYARLYKKYKPKGVELVAVHTPELDLERKPEAVADHVKRFGIEYPVLLDRDNENWNRWHQEYWPTLYLLDGKGRLRSKWVGELHQSEAEVAKAIDRLLAEPS
ncbi:hypothetical protein BH11ARM2_BH11ARM2_00280 [soil metagenome]